MTRMLSRKSMLLGVSAIALLSAATAQAEEEVYEDDAAEYEEIMVTGKKVTFANNATDKVMLDQKAPASSVLAVIDSLPGVLVSEGGIFGSDDWSTTVTMRGFSVGLDQQQIGTTVDGLPNGNSNYGGGSKANRYLDAENMERAEVSQGTADVGSPSHEALGGTMNFISRNPLEDEQFRVGLSYGDNNAQRMFVSYDTGEIFANTTAYVSYSHTDNDAWIGNAGGTYRDHVEAKFVTELEDWTLTGRISFDDSNEDNYQRISLDSFYENPDWDRLTDQLTGIPVIDQNFRPSWSTLRKNFFVYLKAAYEGENFSAHITPYFHQQNGRGDWAPPYLVALDGTGDLQANGTVFGGGYTERVFEVDGNPVMSYRHTHYAKRRLGFTTEGEFQLVEDNNLRVGAWLESTRRDEWRDWHEIINPIASHAFVETAYWRQYDRTFNTDTILLYAEDSHQIGDLKLSAGVKKFFVDIERKDDFGNEANFSKNSDSDVLFSVGAVYNLTEELEVFGGFSQNYAAIKDGVIEDLSDLAGSDNAEIQASIDSVEPESADNIDLGVRYSNDWIRFSLTGYSIKFDNRIEAICSNNVSGIDYLGDDECTYANVGGVKSKGIEAFVDIRLNDNWKLYSALTLNDSKYEGTDVKVALAPEFQLVGTLSYDKDGFNGGISAKHVGKRWGNFTSNDAGTPVTNLDRLPSFTIVDMWVGYTLEGAMGLDAIDFRLNVSNLLNEDYLGGGTPGGYFLGTARQTLATMTFKF
ncbi:TonB-dependent receptor [Emcibacter sp.]|uniref:TonB-dependent receptor n=1 Tax=Emcibacter sp. TaxID=1979954 RepID=UPI002AA83C97|nr:TonB-dependent receptor [Emcibacter sp.]